MKRLWVMAVGILAGACTSPMLVSVDLTQERPSGVLASYGVGLTEIEVKALPYRGSEALPADCKTALDLYDAGRSLHMRKAAAYSVLARRMRDIQDALVIRDWDQDGFRYRPLSEAEKPALTEQVTLLQAATDALLAQEIDTDIAAQAVREQCPDEDRRLEFTSFVEPSPDLLYGLVLKGGVMSSDTVTINAGEDGLLTSVTAAADDKTATAATDAGKLIGRLLAPSPFSDLSGLVHEQVSPPPPGPRPSGGEPGDGCDLDLLTPAQALAVMKARPECVSARTIDDLINALAVIPERYRDLRPPAPPRPQRFSLSELMNGQTYGGIELSANCVPLAPPEGDYAPVTQAGIVIAFPTPCRLIASIDEREVARTTFIGLSEDNLGATPVDRAALVSNSTTVTLQRGMVRTVSATRPSQGAAVVAFPGQVIGGVFAGIGEAFRDSTAVETARLAQLNAEANLATAQADRLEAERVETWTGNDTAYVSAMGVVATRQGDYDRAVGGDPAALLTAEVALANAKAAANAAAALAQRPLPFPDLI